MTGPYPPQHPHGPPPQSVSIGGPGGIQIQGTNIVTSQGYVAPPPGYGAPPPGYAAQPQQHVQLPPQYVQPPQPGTLVPTSQTSGLAEVNKITSKNPRGAAMALGGAGAMMLVVSASMFVMGSGAFLLPVVASLLPIAGALWILRRKPAAQEALSPQLEQRVLELAVRCGGTLTVTGTAHQLGLSLDEAEAALMDLAHKGHVEIDNDEESGAIIYVFPEIQPAPALSAGHPGTAP